MQHVNVLYMSGRCTHAHSSMCASGVCMCTPYGASYMNGGCLCLHTKLHSHEQQELLQSHTKPRVQGVACEALFA